MDELRFADTCIFRSVSLPPYASEKADSTGSTGTGPNPEHIAIVGMSGRFPGSESIAEFWQSLLDQKEFHSKVSKHFPDYPTII